MITFDSLTLKAFLSQEDVFLKGSRISKIQQPTRREFIFTLRNNGKNRKFYVNINPQMYHVCFVSDKNFEKRLFDIPQNPPMFCMLLRKYLSNSVISKVSQPDNERILELYVETYNEIGDKIYLCLAIELMGKYSNVVLYNCDTEIILGCAHNVGIEKSRLREMYGTIPYVYPPKQNKSDIMTYNGEVDFDNLSENFYMFSRAFSDLCRGKSLEKLKDYVQLKGLSPAVSSDNKYYCLYSELLDNPVKSSSVNDMIDDYYSYYISLNKFIELKNLYKTLVNQKLKKVVKSLTEMEKQLEKSKNSDNYRLWGDLLLSNLYNLEDYSSVAEVFDYENDKNITIKLDDSKTIKDNANKFYKLYTKSKTSVLKLTELSADLIKSKRYFEDILYSVQVAENIFELRELSSEIEVDKISQKQVKPNFEPLKIDLGNETRIYIGKNNKQNDFIVSKLASDDDLWFHVKGFSGSHVLLKTQKVTDELIKQCAEFAKKYSSASNSIKAGVIYTKRKYLRKPPKANLGYVTYKNEKEIIIN